MNTLVKVKENELGLKKTENQFIHEVFGNLTTITNEFNEVFFVSNEVSSILDYSENRKMLERLDDDEIVKLSYEETKRLSPTVDIHSSGIQLLTESGLYSAVLGSRKPEAKQFKKWVTGEVLPSIRKTGNYSISQAPLPQIPQTYAQALRLAADQQDVIEQQAEKLQLQAPKVEFADDIKASVNSIEMDEFAKIIGKPGLGRNNMYRLFRDEKILYGDNTPYQYYIDNGTLEKDLRVMKNYLGQKETYYVTMITGKGIQYFQNFLKKKNYI